MAKALTTIGLENVKPGPVRREIPDGLLPGLYFIVQPKPSGARSWAVRYRIGGKPRKHTLGAYPTLELPDARDLARAALRAVAEGRDPSEEKKARKVVDEAAARAEQDTIEAVAGSFVERYAKANTRASSWRETERVLNKEVIGADAHPVWRGRNIREITKRDVIDLLDGIVDRGAPVMANRTLAALRRMFNWAVERGIVDASPCQQVKPPTAEASRDRVLSDAEMRAVWTASDELAWPFGPLVQVLALTAQRREEVARMTWAEVDLGNALWTLPRERVKNNTAHEVPLSPQVVAILAKLPRVKGKAGLVFTTTGETPVAGFSRAKSRLDDAVLAALRKAAREAGDDPAAIEAPARWTLHDLRRTAASGMARLGVQLPVVEKILNHTSGSFAGVAGVYQRHSFADEKRAALALWARHVEAIVSPSVTSNVRELAAAR